MPLYWEDLRPAARRWIGSAVAVVVFSAVLLRSWKVFAWPGFFLEDGVLWFNFYYGGNHAIIDIFRAPQGYARLNCELLAWLFAKADICLQPYLYTWFSLVVGVLTCVSVIRLDFVKSTFFVICAPVILALISIPHVIYFAAMIGTAWMLVIWFLLLLLQDPPQKNLAYLIHLMLILLLSWCHPYTLVGIPAAWLAWAFFPGKKRLITALCLTLSLAGMLYFLHPGQSGLTHLVNLEKATWYAERFVDVLTNEVFLFGLLERPSLITGGITILLIAIILVFLRSRKRLLKMSLILLFIAGSTVALFFLTNRYDGYRHLDHVPARYLLIANFFWILVLMGWLEEWMAKRALLQRAVPVGIAAAVGLVVLANAARYENYVFATGQKRGHKTALFTRAIKYYEGRSETWHNRYVHLRLNRKMRRFQPSVYIGRRSPTSVNVGALPDVESMPFEQFIVRPRAAPRPRS